MTPSKIFPARHPHANSCWIAPLTIWTAFPRTRPALLTCNASLAWGYQRIAVVQGDATESNLGDVEASLASDRKALALFELVAKANPNNTIDQLNVAMMHRILSYSSLNEESGRRDLDQAMAITERLIKQEPANPKIKSERSIEFQISVERALMLATMQRDHIPNYR